MTITRLQAQDWVIMNPVFDPAGNYNTYNGFFIDEHNGWWTTLFPGMVWHTTSEGRDWKRPLDSTNAGLSDIKFTDSLHGWIVGRTLRNPDNVNFLLITNDGGKHWNKILTPTIECVTFFDSLNGFAGGDSIYSTSNGGITWRTQMVEPSVGFGLTDIFFSDRKYGWAVGGSNIHDVGVVICTVDSGKTWQFQAKITSVGNAVYFTDSLHGCVVGSTPPTFQGMIKMTSDGGKSWSTRHLPCSWLNDVVFINDSVGWAVGDYGYIWLTTDQGVSWKQVESGTTSHLYRIFFFDGGSIGYILGADGTLLKYDKTVNLKEEKPFSPISFSLSQNFPNPFNSTTKIDFSIEHASFTTLAIYDVLGRNVSTLVSDNLNAGSYSRLWRADNHPSGVYFYRLESSEYSETKKLIMQK